METISDFFPEDREVPPLPASSIRIATQGRPFRVSYICGKVGGDSDSDSAAATSTSGTWASRIATRIYKRASTKDVPTVLAWSTVRDGHIEYRQKCQAFYQNAAWTFSKPLGTFTLYIYNPSSPRMTPQKITEDMFVNDIKLDGTIILLKVEKKSPFSKSIPAAHKRDFLSKACTIEGRGREVISLEERRAKRLSAEAKEEARERYLEEGRLAASVASKVHEQERAELTKRHDAAFKEVLDQELKPYEAVLQRINKAAAKHTGPKTLQYIMNLHDAREKAVFAIIDQKFKISREFDLLWYATIHKHGIAF